MRKVTPLVLTAGKWVARNLDYDLILGAKRRGGVSYCYFGGEVTWFGDINHRIVGAFKTERQARAAVERGVSPAKGKRK